MGLLNRKRAVVCGSSQGIGRAIAQQFAALGAEVLLVARDKAALQSVANNLDTSAGQIHRVIVADFSEPETLKESLAAALRDNAPVHILVNNTGGPPGGTLQNAQTSEFLNAFSQHLICNQILVQTLAPGMKRLAYGRIINIISTSVKQPIEGLGVSNTIRGAVANWSKTLATELAPFGITVNNILPGATDTARLTSIIESNAAKLDQSTEQICEQMKSAIPMGRFAKPEEIAYAAGFLASDWGGYVTGINLPVDGGRTACL